MSESLPLEGIRVADFTQALSGPYCTMLLADLGADVVKVEMPGRGDDSRHWGPPFVGDTAAYFLAVNRNKRSIELDLRSPSGRAAAAALVASSDVLVENWRPGTAARLGLDAATLTERHPRLVHCSISGFGGDGPPRGRPPLAPVRPSSPSARAPCRRVRAGNLRERRGGSPPAGSSYRRRSSR